jgi:4-aminobutyrate aminotransferase-like enzyme
MNNADLIERRNQLIGSGAALFYREPVRIVRGQGAYLYDENGKQYVDMYNNVPCVGHANPAVVAAMHEQAATLNVHSRYLHEGILDYAERLAMLHAEHLQSTVFACSGTEANEVAMTMARTVTGGRGFICTDAAYHGNSQQVGMLTRTAIDQTRHAEVRSIPYPQKYRPLEEGIDESALCVLYLAEVSRAIAELEAADIKLAGMLVCPLLANEGLPDIPQGFMRQAADLIRAAGGLFIVDEVQSGFCRSGEWWGYEVMEATPDIVTMGKPMGNGLPLAACIASREAVEQYRAESRYFNTFASSPLQAATGMAVLDEIEQHGLRQNARDTGHYLREALAPYCQRYEPLAEVRGQGLFVGLEWVSDRQAKTPDRDGAVDVINAMKDKGFLMGNAGALGNMVKLRPPLVFGQREADAFLDAFGEVMQDLYGSG